jgi:hypothetical protein
MSNKKRSYNSEPEGESEGSSTKHAKVNEVIIKSAILLVKIQKYYGYDYMKIDYVDYYNRIQFIMFLSYKHIILRSISLKLKM